MTAKEAFSLIYSRVKVKENFVPRKYQTIGGMWTVDTYMLGNIIAQSMDEGYTDKIIGEKVVAIRYHTGIIEYMKGDETDLINLVGELHETDGELCVFEKHSTNIVCLNDEPVVDSVVMETHLKVRK